MCNKFRTSLVFLGLFLIASLSGCGSSGNSNDVISTSGAVSSSADGVSLGEAGKFALLGETLVDTVAPSVVTGNVGVSPAANGYLTGWELVAAPDASNVYSTSDQVVAPYKLYAADYAPPTPLNLSNAVLDMGAAYGDAFDRELITEDNHNIDATTLGNEGVVLAPGVYRWDTILDITTDVTLDGRATDVWIIQVGTTLSMAADKSILLTGGAVPQNVFWQVGGAMSIGTGAHFEGVVLGAAAITFLSDSSIKGRLLSQTAINIKACTVTVP